MTDQHQHDWQTPGARLHFGTVLDDWLGPTFGLLSCEGCGQYALAHLAGWQGPGLVERIFSVRELPEKAARVYLHNIARDYCDASRKSSETEALIRTAELEASLVSVTLPDEEIRAVSSHRCNPPVLRWQDVPETAFDHWQQFLSGS